MSSKGEDFLSTLKVKVISQFSLIKFNTILLHRKKERNHAHLGIHGNKNIRNRKWTF